MYVFRVSGVRATGVAVTGTEPRRPFRVPFSRGGCSLSNDVPAYTGLPIRMTGHRRRPATPGSGGDGDRHRGRGQRFYLSYTLYLVVYMYSLVHTVSIKSA